jgi:hypothetical protein
MAITALEKIKEIYEGEKSKRKFIDMTHDGSGKIGKVYYNPTIKKYEFERIN